MSGFKRFGLIVFGLAGALCLAALALPWIGPFQRLASDLMLNTYYYLAMQVCLAITSAGVLVALVRGLLTPRQSKTVVIDKTGGDQITVSTAAISSQATHVVERDGRFVAEKVRVRARKNGNVVVDVRVRPRHTVDVSREGQHLHDELSAGLATICGDKIRHVNLQFVEAELAAPAEPEEPEIPEVPLSVYERASRTQDMVVASNETNDITVTMGHGDFRPTAEDEDVIEPYAIESEGE